MDPFDTPDQALRTAELYALGVGRGELAGPGWRNPFRGVHRPEAPTDGPLQRVYDAAELLVPGAAIGGWAAGYLLGAHELDGLGRAGREPEPVMLLTPTRQHPCPRPGVRTFRSKLDPDDVVEINGIPVTAPLRTAFDLARASSLEDGVVAVDALARAARIDLHHLAGYVRRHPRFRGVPVAREVVALADPRARSSGESRLRVVWIVDARLPRPEVNPLILTPLGEVVAMTDLLDPLSGLVGEYDGSTHRELDEHTTDNGREEDMEDRGLVVVRATSLDVGPRRPGLVRRLLTGHRRAQESRRRSWGWAPTRPPPPRQVVGSAG